MPSTPMFSVELRQREGVSLLPRRSLFFDLVNSVYEFFRRGFGMFLLMLKHRDFITHFSVVLGLNATGVDGCY